MQSLLKILWKTKETIMQNLWTSLRQSLLVDSEVSV